jgi:hypothetical protein
MPITTIYRIHAAIQPKKRAKWIQIVIDYGEQGTGISLVEAMSIAKQMQRELEAEHPEWTNGDYGVEHSRMWRQA